MKLVNREELLKIPCPVAYVREATKQEVEIKISQDDDTFAYKKLVSFNFLNTEYKENFFYDNDIEQDKFYVFELNDMQYLIIPLAECFDARTKESFR